MVLGADLVDDEHHVVVLSWRCSWEVPSFNRALVWFLAGPEAR